MIKCIVEMYGLSSEITGRREVEIELQDEASLGDVVGALRHKIPVLEGRVIRAGEDRLIEYYAFNINGHFYFDDREEVQLQNGEHVALLTLATGG